MRADFDQQKKKLKEARDELKEHVVAFQNQTKLFKTEITKLQNEAREEKE